MRITLVFYAVVHACCEDPVRGASSAASVSKLSYW